MRRGVFTLRSAGDPTPFPEGTVEPVEAPSSRMPTIGLALGGGSARGWSHIGVIAALAEAGIHPAVVAGCSIGAVVGGCYAAGKLDDLTAFALSLTKRRVVGLLDVRLTGSGLIAGDRLRRRLAQDLDGRRIEALPVRFASVATEHGTGREVWLANGPLIEAVCASYAIPGIFPPVALDNRLLMDGTLVNPVPVSLARDLGAELVICVNLGGDPQARSAIIRPTMSEGDAAEDDLADAIDEAVRIRGRWTLLRNAGRRIVGRPIAVSEARSGPSTPGVARMVLDAFNITQDRISRARLATDPPDIAITPNLQGMGLFEFHRAAEAIALGRAAADAALPAIRRTLAGMAARV